MNPTGDAILIGDVIIRKREANRFTASRPRSARTAIEPEPVGLAAPNGNAQRPRVGFVAGSDDLSRSLGVMPLTNHDQAALRVSRLDSSQQLLFARIAGSMFRQLSRTWP